MHILYTRGESTIFAYANRIRAQNGHILHSYVDPVAEYDYATRVTLIRHPGEAIGEIFPRGVAFCVKASN